MIWSNDSYLNVLHQSSWMLYVQTYTRSPSCLITAKKDIFHFWVHCVIKSKLHDIILKFLQLIQTLFHFCERKCRKLTDRYQLWSWESKKSVILSRFYIRRPNNHFQMQDNGPKLCLLIYTFPVCNCTEFKKPSVKDELTRDIIVP